MPRGNYLNILLKPTVDDYEVLPEKKREKKKKRYVG